jgi:translation initiation factor 1
MNDFKNKLVWSDDPKDKAKLEEKPSGPPEATDDFIKSLKWTAVFRIEKAQRGGKTVTVIDQLPRQENFVRDLCKELKAKCGSGGTYSLKSDCGLIEIQGDKREAIKALFVKKGFKFKGM